jgi:hypothetical protein
MSGVDLGDQITSGYNDSFLRLDPTKLSVLDFFTPDNNLLLEQNDVDLGGGSNILAPDNSSSTPHETIGGGKDGNVFVVYRDAMGSFSPTQNNVIQTLQTGTQRYDNVFSIPVYWNGFIYYHAIRTCCTPTAGTPLPGCYRGPRPRLYPFIACMARLLHCRPTAS